MRKFFAVCLFIFTLFPLISISQEVMYVPYFSSEGCSRQTGISSAILFADYVNQYGKFKADLSGQKDSSAPAETFNEARESADLISSKYFILGKVIKLDGHYYVQTSLYASSSGNLFWSDSRQAGTSADLMLAIKDLARRVADLENKGMEDDLFMNSATEGKKLNRIQTNKSLGFITGFMMPMSEEESNKLNPGFGGVMSFDARDFIFETTAEVYFGSDSLYDGASYDNVSNQYLNLGLNAIYPLNSRNNTPFLSISSGLSYRKSEVKYTIPTSTSIQRDFIYNHGLLLSAGGGYILKRNTDASLFIYARGYMFMMDTDRYMYGLMINFSLQFELNSNSHE